MDKKGLKWTAVDSLYWAGSALLSLGVGLLALPAGLIVAGVCCLAASFLIERGGDVS